MSKHHVLRCPSGIAWAKWESSLTVLEDWLTLNCMQQDVKSGIMAVLRSWCKQEEVPTLVSNCDDVANGFQAQQETHADALVVGFVSLTWASVQDQHFKWINRRNTGEWWVSSLTIQPWNISWDVWNQRVRILDEPYSTGAAVEHQALDLEITNEHQRFHAHFQPPDHLSRWFV